MKRIFMVLAVLAMGWADNIYADLPTGNASPATVCVNSTTRTQEVTFPQVIRNLSVFNYDPDDGVWINLRGGDTSEAGVNASRFYLGPASVLTLNDFLTPAITIVYDDGYYSAGEASPVQVIATY